MTDDAFDPTLWAVPVGDPVAPTPADTPGPAPGPPARPVSADPGFLLRGVDAVGFDFHPRLRRPGEAA